MKKVVEKISYGLLLVADSLVILLLLAAMYATLRQQNISVGLSNQAWYAFNSYTELLFYGAFFISAVLLTYAGTILLRHENRRGYALLGLPVLMLIFMIMSR